MLSFLGCMNNVDFEKKIRWQHCARCVYYLSEIMMFASNLKIPYSYVLIDLQSNPQRVHGLLPRMWKVSNTASFNMCEF